MGAKATVLVGSNKKASIMVIIIIMPHRHQRGTSTFLEECDVLRDNPFRAV